MGDTIRGMGVWAPVAFFGIIFSFIAWFIVSRLRAARTRRTMIGDWARGNGMEFVEGPLDATRFASLPSLRTSERVTGCLARNVVRGMYGTLPVSIFDLHRHLRTQMSTRTRYETDSGTFALFELPGRPLPGFEFSPAGRGRSSRTCWPIRTWTSSWPWPPRSPSVSRPAPEKPHRRGLRGRLDSRHARHHHGEIKAK